MKLQMIPTSSKYSLAFDPDGLSTVAIRQATNGDEIKLAKLTEKQAWRDGDNGNRELILKWNPRERERFQAYLTLVGADLEYEDGTPVFRFKDGKNGPELAMNELEFNKAWDNLPAKLCDEIVDHIYDANPQWGDTPGE